MAFRSPRRVARIPEGMLVAIDPIPMSALINAATAVLAPRSIEPSAMTGIIEPSARPNNVAGPNAATAIDRRLNSPLSTGGADSADPSRRRNNLLHGN